MVKENILQEGQQLKEKDEFNLNLAEMAQAGLHFGQKTSKTHSKMLPYIAGIRNTIHIIDLEKTAQKFKEALDFIKSLLTENKIILFVGTKIQIKDLVKETAQALDMPYVIERWLGGTFTNFPVILKRIEYLKELEEKQKQGEFEKYTKKEKKKIEEELAKLKEKFEGMKTMQRLPDAVFICDMIGDKGAVKEARIKNIPSIAICDTNCNPTLVDFPIPANDDAITSVKYILDKVKEVGLSIKTKSIDKQIEN